MDITKSTPDVPPLELESEPERSLIGGDAPLLLAAARRLKCDMVLALAIVHHLALGQGLRLSDIVQTLSKYVNKCLVVEFVAIDDQLIVNEPSFFPALQADPGKFGWYTLDNLTKELELGFSPRRNQTVFSRVAGITHLYEVIFLAYLKEKRWRSLKGPIND